MPEDSEGGGSFLRGGGAGGGRGVMNIRYHWSSSPTAALASHCRPPCFHLALVTHHPVILLVLSLSLSVSPHPPAPPTSLFKHSPLKPRVLQAISWGHAVLPFMPRESPASYFPSRASSQGNSAVSFYNSNCGFVFFPLHIDVGGGGTKQE